MRFLGFSLLEGFELVSVSVLWLGDCFVPSCWIGDGVVEVVVCEGGASWSVDVVRGVVGGVEELPVGGEWFVFGFKLDRQGLNLFFTQMLSVNFLFWVFCSGCGNCMVVVACDLLPDVFGLVHFFRLLGLFLGGLLRW